MICNRTTSSFALMGILTIAAACSQAPDAEQDQILFNAAFLPEAKVGAAYVADLGIHGGTPPREVKLLAGTLPDGISISGESLMGTPIKEGVYLFKLGVKDSGPVYRMPTQDYTLVVAPQGNSLSFVSKSVPIATVATSYSQTLSVAGGKPPYQFTRLSGQIPVGMTLNTSTGSIYGIPNKSGVFQFVVRVEDKLKAKDDLNLSLVVVSSQKDKPSASLQPSRTSGVAPLSVFFDASASTSSKYSRVFHHLQYDWDFDDAESSHPISSGPLSGHVFNKAGNYEVRVSVTDPAGQVDSKVVMINVLDPDRIYAGQKTICFSNSKSFGGAPSGAKLITTNSFDAAAKYVGAGVRLLFRRGDTFVCKSPLNVRGNGPTSIGAFGVGTNPDKNGKFGNNPRVVSQGAVPILLYGQDARVMDLSFVEQAGYKVMSAVSTEYSTKNCLALRLDSKGFNSPIMASHDTVEYYKTAPHDGFTLADSVLVDARWMSLYMGGLRFLLVGNQVLRSDTQHILRVTFAKKLVLDGNTFAYPASATHAIKLHAQQTKSRYGPATEQIVIRDNEIRGTSAWLVTLGPQNSAYNEVVREVLVEKNRFFSENTCQVSLLVNSADTTIRNNVFVNKGGQSGWNFDAILITRRGIEPIPSGCEVYHNTFYNPDAGFSTNVLVTVASHTGKALVMNNLVYAPKSKISSAVAGGAPYSSAGNLSGQDPRFINAAGLDFGLRTGSPAIGKGVPVPVVDDYKGRRRDMTKSTRTAGSYSK